MKKIFRLFILSLFINSSFSQEVSSIYEFRIEEKKRMFTYSEIDSLVLYKNGSFYQKKSYLYHESINSELKGSWKIEKGILYLSINVKKESLSDINWMVCKDEFTYRLKRNKLIPKNIGSEKVATRKLKLIK